jgi:hypothetical protein
MNDEHTLTQLYNAGRTIITSPYTFEHLQEEAQAQGTSAEEYAQVLVNGAGVVDAYKIYINEVDELISSGRLGSGEFEDMFDVLCHIVEDKLQSTIDF